ncbi:MAG: caspase family protein [Desulfobacteraceae bacterium]|nr:caspase family protein [Desulfobacteraceae bacterium]
MSRYAILLANSARSPDERTNVNSERLKTNTSEIKKQLESIGNNYRFEVEQILDKKVETARGSLDQAAKNAYKAMNSENDFVLFYYFGHGVIRCDKLYFYFKNSNDSQTATMISFDQVADILYGYNIAKVLFVIDCCHSGKAIDFPIFSGRKFSIVASCTDKEKAFVKPSHSPFGAFSTIFFSGLLDKEAAEPLSKNVTTKSLFDHTCQILDEDKFEQQPVNKDGGLNSLVLSEAHIKRYIKPEFNDNANVKSFYKKLRWIGSEINNESGISIENLYDRVIEDEPPEMLTPDLSSDNGNKVAPVKFATFNTYIDRMDKLNIINNNGGLRLTRTGKSLFAKNEQKFNTVMETIIENQLNEAGSSLAGVDKLIFYKLKTRGIPTAMQLYYDAKRRERLKMDSGWFGILLDLAANIGYFRGVSRKTYFSFDESGLNN